ncbi:MAG: acetyl-CoA synthase, partial [Methanomicrobiales archaeon]|nr:acetyl-CoA synthase [Methanomicrobiales archaeon]
MEEMTWSGEIDRVTIGATREEGGTRSHVCTVGGAKNLPFLGKDPAVPRIALEICDEPGSWSPLVLEYTGDAVQDPGEWAKKAEKEFGADLLRLYLNSTKKRGFSDTGS